MSALPPESGHQFGLELKGCQHLVPNCIRRTQGAASPLVGWQRGLRYLTEVEVMVAQGRLMRSVSSGHADRVRVGSFCR